MARTFFVTSDQELRFHHECGALADRLRRRDKCPFDPDMLHEIMQGVIEKGDSFLSDLIAEAAIKSIQPRSSTFTPSVADGVFIFEVNYDETIEAKLATKDATRLVCVTGIATDDRYPDTRTGKIVRTGRIQHFNKFVSQEEIDRWCADNGKVLATPKEGIDFCKAFQRPALDADMPLLFAGKVWTDSHGLRYELYANLHDGKRILQDILLSRDGGWGGHWRFLVLDK